MAGLNCLVGTERKWANHEPGTPIVVDDIDFFYQIENEVKIKILVKFAIIFTFTSGVALGFSIHGFKTRPKSKLWLSHPILFMKSMGLFI